MEIVHWVFNRFKKSTNRSLSTNCSLHENIVTACLQSCSCHSSAKPPVLSTKFSLICIAIVAHLQSHHLSAKLSVLSTNLSLICIVVATRLQSYHSSLQTCHSSANRSHHLSLQTHQSSLKPATHLFILVGVDLKYIIVFIFRVYV